MGKALSAFGRAALVWTLLVAVLAVPMIAAALSPLLAWRGPVYIAAGFSGVVALGLLLVQPLLAGGHLPGLSASGTRRAHRAVGLVLLAALIVHVAALWATSPPDVIDVLLFSSPTPFSVWGVIAMWAVFVTAALAGLRRVLKLKPRNWLRAHKGLAFVIVGGSIAHAMLIIGTMETFSKAMLCAAVAAATGKVIYDRWAMLRGRASQADQRRS